MDPGLLLADTVCRALTLNVVLAEQILNEAAQRLRENGKQPDLLGVHDRLANADELEAVGGIAYIAALGDGLPRISPVAQWAQLIRDRLGCAES